MPNRGAEFKKYNAVSGENLDISTITRRFGKYKNFCEQFIKYKIGFISKNQLLLELKKQKNKRENILTRLGVKSLKKCNYTCQDCGVSPRNDDEFALHIHHIVPVSKEGKNNEENLTVNCTACNLGKSDILNDTVVIKDNKIMWPKRKDKKKPKIGGLNHALKLYIRIFIGSFYFYYFRTGSKTIDTDF